MYKIGDEVAYINNVLRYSKVVKVLTATMGMSEYKLENGKWVWEMYLIPSPIAKIQARISSAKELNKDKKDGEYGYHFTEGRIVEAEQILGLLGEE